MFTCAVDLVLPVASPVPGISILSLARIGGCLQLFIVVASIPLYDTCSEHTYWHTFIETQTQTYSYSYVTACRDLDYFRIQSYLH